MLKISKKVGYALMALKFIKNKKSGELTSAREICDELKIPFDTTAKVMQKMNRFEILDSVQGVSGGYTIAPKLHETTVAELHDIIEGKDAHKKCHNCSDCDISETCNVKMPVGALKSIMQKTLESIKVEDLLTNDIELEVSHNE